MSKRGRRRRRNDENCELEGNEEVVANRSEIAAEDSKSVENNSRILVRRDTFTVLKRETAFESAFSSEIDNNRGGDKDEIKSEFEIQSDSDNSKNLTHTINVDTYNTESSMNGILCDDSSASKHDTYCVQKNESDRPVPAPRRRQSLWTKEPDKNSSDTDKDVMEIEVDEGKWSNSTDTSEKAIAKTTTNSDTSVVEPPKPKPRKLSIAFPRTDSISKSKSLEEITVKVMSPRSTKSDPETKRIDFDQSAAIEEKETKLIEEKSGMKTRIIAALLHRKKEKKSSMFSSRMKLEKSRIPTISAILSDLKEDLTRGKLEEEDAVDFEMDSPRFPQSVQNDKMYVQGKNGFYLTNREEVLKKDEDFLTSDGGTMEDSASSSNLLKTGLFFQKYWSRSMMNVHGLLAGFGLGHAFAISAIPFYLNQFEKFVQVYSFVALKIHFTFYTLITLSIISCLDRLDIGYTSKKHWRNICVHFPGSWFVLFIYATSISLTFANHHAAFKFDDRRYGNETGDEFWDAEVRDDMRSTFSSWYRIVWARDVTVLAAWLVISLTNYSDNLYLYMENLASRFDDYNRKLGIVFS